jgi:WD40 repeat protein
MGPVRIWQVATASERRSLSAELTGVFGLAFSPDGKWLVTAGESRLRLYAADRDFAWTRDLPAGGQRQVSVVFSPDGKWLVAGGYDGVARWWNTSTWERGAESAAMNDRITALAFHPDGAWLAIGGCGLMRANGGFAIPVLSADIVRLVAGTSGKLVQELPVRGSHLAFSPDGKTLYAAGIEVTNERGANPGRGMIIINGQTLAPEERVVALDLASLRVKPVAARQGGLVALSPDGRMLAHGGRDELHFGTNRGGFLQLGRVGSADLFLRERCSDAVPATQTNRRATALVWTRDGQRLLIGQSDGIIALWQWAGAVPAVRGDTWPADEIVQAWADLGSNEGLTAFRAINKLRATPRATVEYLEQQLHPARALNAEQVQQWLADLNHPRYRIRDEAHRALGKLGSPIRPALETALRPPVPPEVRWRVEELLGRIENQQLSADELRQLRAVLLLERVGTPAALALLQTLGRGTPAAPLTQAAQEAARRVR